MVPERVASIEGVGGSAGDGELVRSLLVARDRLDARLCEALVGFFSAGRHDVEGWRSPVGWLKANGALTDRDAKRLAVRADRLGRWPALARAWFDGALSGAQVEVVVALIPVGLVDLFAAHDTEVSPLLVGLTAAQTRVAVREWVVRADAVTSPDPAEVDQPVEVDARVRLSRTSGGRGVLDGDLDALDRGVVRDRPAGHATPGHPG